MSHDIENKGKQTQAIHAGQDPCPITGAVSVPIFQSSTFAFPNAEEGRKRFTGESDGYIYTRLGNPTIEAFEENIKILEGGYAARATSTGMAAVTTALLSFLGAGDHMIGTDAVYGPSRLVVEHQFSRFGIEYSFVNTADYNEIEKAIKPNTKVIYVETPANPTIKITDIKKCADIAHKKGAILIVDNTFMTPILQNPLELGADIVVHSVTKFINGHADIVGGVIIVSDKKFIKPIDGVLRNFGCTMDPHQAWLALRGVKSLPLRVKYAQDNAVKLAAFLEKHPKVEWIRYPGLESHPQYKLGKEQMKGTGALMAFGLHGGLEAGRVLMDNVELLVLAVSLGGIESLIQHPASMTHAGMTPQERLEAGITDGLVRISVGCEDYGDIEADIKQALDKIK